MGAAILLWSVAPVLGSPVLYRCEVDDLPLISLEDEDIWDDRWIGRIEAAAVLAWFADHGYATLLPDINRDGAIDSLDVVALADTLGRSDMASDTADGTRDARLVHGLAPRRRRLPRALRPEDLRCEVCPRVP
jgi:hypothetical protein